MNIAFNRARAFTLCGAATLAVGCTQTTDPTTQEPVDPKPGQYEITLSGAGLMKNMKEEPHSYCLYESERDAFPHMLAKNYYELHPGCRAKHDPREGNAISGVISCAADPKMATGMNSFVYEGVVGEERVKVDVQIKFDAKLKEGAGGEMSDGQLKLAMKAMERMRFVIEAVRTGDC